MAKESSLENDVKAEVSDVEDGALQARQNTPSRTRQSLPMYLLRRTAKWTACLGVVGVGTGLILGVSSAQGEEHPAKYVAEFIGLCGAYMAFVGLLVPGIFGGLLDYYKFRNQNNSREPNKQA